VTPARRRRQLRHRDRTALRRTFTYRGKARSYAVAGCPAPKGFPGAVFPFAKATYSFAGGGRLTSTLSRSCEAR